MTKRRLHFTKPALPRDGAPAQLVSLLSGKGGVGKSVLAFNLAERLAARDTSVLLVDLDVSCGNLHILANSVCRYGVVQLVTEELTVAEAVTPVRQSLHLLMSDGRGWPQGMTAAGGAAQLAKILRAQGGAYDLIMIDHPSGKSDATLVMAAASDTNLLVVVPELTSISDACGLYKLLLQTDRSLDCRLLINRAANDEEADYIHQKFGALTERFYGRQPGYLGRLLEDDVFRQAVANQSPLAAVDGNSPALTDLERLAARLAPRVLTETVGTLTNDETAINKVPAEADIKG